MDVFETLQQALDARRILWLFCLACGHADKRDPRWFKNRYAVTYLSEIEAKLRCRKCGRKHGYILPSITWIAR